VRHEVLGLSDALVRHDLCQEAIRLGRTLAELMTGEPEVIGLLALMELQASRAATRADAEGELVLLADQDRSRWDRAQIVRGLALLDRAGPLERAGPYQLQAAIAACHARALSWESTDWPAIVQRYRQLADVAPSPVVELNRAVAIGLAEGALAGLDALDAIDVDALRAYHFLPAARADFLRRLGRFTEAAEEYRRALALADNARERRFLSARLAEVSSRESD
jgi:predicted RNA polymerase sigma factor